MYEGYKTGQKYYFLTPNNRGTEELFFVAEMPGDPNKKYLFKDKNGNEVYKSDNDQAWWRRMSFGNTSASKFNTNLGGKMRRRMRRTNKKANKKSHKKSHNITQKKSNKKSHKKTRKNKY